MPRKKKPNKERRKILWHNLSLKKRGKEGKKNEIEKDAKEDDIT